MALIEVADLSESQYHMAHMQANKRNADIYPAYDNLAKAKEERYPHSIEVTETGFTIELKFLLDHTISGMFESRDIFLPFTDTRKPHNFKLII